MLEYMSGALAVASLTLSAVLQNEEAHNMSVEEAGCADIVHVAPSMALPWCLPACPSQRTYERRALHSQWHSKHGGCKR